MHNMIHTCEGVALLENEDGTLSIVKQEQKDRPEPFRQNLVFRDVDHLRSFALILLDLCVAIEGKEIAPEDLPF